MGTEDTEIAIVDGGAISLTIAVGLAERRQVTLIEPNEPDPGALADYAALSGANIDVV